jgi:hypothetical protein
MATYSQQFREAVKRMIKRDITADNILDYEKDLFKLNTYGQLVVSLTEPLVFVPVFLRSIFVIKPIKEYIELGNDAVLCPITHEITEDIQEVKTAEEAFKYWASLYKLRTISLGTNVYHGANGIIMDKYHNLLLLTGNMLIPDNNDIVGTTIYFSEQIITQTEDPMCKFLLRKLMPYTISELFTNLRHRYRPNVQIENLNRFILKPIVIPWLNDINTSVRGLLINNMDEIMENLEK